MLSAVPLWFHLLAAAVWVGSQVMMVAIVLPATRKLAPGGPRDEVMRAITSRFAVLGFAALFLLLLTGLDNVSRYSPADMFSFRYGYILAAKISMYVIVVLLTAYHAFIVGPQLLAAQADRPVPSGLRKRSIFASSAVLLLSLAILFCAALLRSRFALGTA